jgi:hypothetical protein
MSRSQMAVAEKRQVVKLTFDAGARVALVTRAHTRVNASAHPVSIDYCLQKVPSDIICLHTGTRLSTRSLPLCSIVLVRKKDCSRVAQRISTGQHLSTRKGQGNPPRKI